MALLLSVYKYLNRIAPFNSQSVASIAVLLTGCLLSLTYTFAEPANTVFKNGLVYTVNSNNDIAQAIAIAGGKIVAVGSNKEIEGSIDGSTKVIDLGGKMLMPGLIDAHMHPLGGGAQLQSCSLNYESLTIDEILFRITACLEADESKSSAQWLKVQGWFRQAMRPAGADLTAEILDRLPTKRPVIVLASDFHTMAANSKVMEIAGIDRESPDPSNGKIVRDQESEATGIFLDGAMWVVSEAEATLSKGEQDRQNVVNLEAALAALAAQGVTSILDAAASEDGIEAFQQLMKAGKLTVRSAFSPVITPQDAANPQQVVDRLKRLGKKFNTPRDSVSPGLSVRTAKMFIDGVIQAPAQTAALVQPYLHNVGTLQEPGWRPSDKSGSLYFDERQLTPLILALAANNLDPHLHTDGDRAVKISLNAVAAMRQQFRDTDIRPAFAHDELVEPDDYVRFTRLRVIPILSFQWGKPAPDTLDSVKDYIGPARFPYLETSGKFHQAGARVAFGSDWPVDRLNEWFAMKVAVTRSGSPDSDPKYQGRLGDDLGLDISTAIRAFTINAAYSLRMDQYVGSLEVGKFADLIVIDRNLTTIAPEQIADTNVLLTLVGGQEVYRAKAFSKK